MPWPRATASRRASVPPATARSSSSTRPAATEPLELAVVGVHAGRGPRRASPWPVSRVETIGEDDEVIRLGSLAGYPFEGPRVLAGWTPPAAAAVLRDPRPSRSRCEGRAVRRHLRGSFRGSGGRTLPVQPSPGRLLAATSGRSVQARDLHVRGAGRTALHREQIVRELTAIYRPSCNTEQYDAEWKDQWIGDYQAPTAGPLSTPRDPG